MVRAKGCHQGSRFACSQAAGSGSDPPPSQSGALFHVNRLDPHNRIPGALLAFVLVLGVEIESGKTPPARPGDAKSEDTVVVGENGLQGKGTLRSLDLGLCGKGLFVEQASKIGRASCRERV